MIIPPFVMEGRLLQECILNNGLNIRVEIVASFLLILNVCLNNVEVPFPQLNRILFLLRD